MTDEINESENRKQSRGFLAAALFLYGISSFSAVAHAAESPPPPAAPSISYARLADLILASQTIATVKVKSLAVLPPERAPGLLPGQSRFYVEAESIGLIRGDSVIARKVAFLIDGPTAKAKKPGLKGRTLILFGKSGSNVAQLQLTSSSAAVDWSPANEALTRRVLKDAIASNLPPAITGISSAFHVAGAIRGESETQIFLDTADGTPISLSVIRRPDEQPRFSASLGEIVDDAASIPEPETMLWYRLACSLPQSLPPRALRGVEQADAQAATRDYLAFRQALAPCDRAAKPVI
ncbi:hypothetical protein FHS91_001846 [Sphingobium xanthum]|jgi:hypothetical protein|uniref:hypothetical protein n=1 Tax=Sphingobium xanthum TaxID=1387165 RepID=UPI001C8CEB97|nr:hypothetical protein [Sphingobium xanthum]